MSNNAGNAIYYLLSHDATVTGIVGNKISPVANLKQTAAPPWVTFQKVSVVNSNTKDAPSTLEFMRYQINCVHTLEGSASGVSVLMEAVRNALDYKSGTINGVSVNHITYMDEGDLPYINAAQLDGLFGKRMDFMVAINRG